MKLKKLKFNLSDMMKMAVLNVAEKRRVNKEQYSGAGRQIIFGWYYLLWDKCVSHYCVRGILSEGRGAVSIYNHRYFNTNVGNGQSIAL